MSVTAAKGFVAGGMHAGVKGSGAADLAIIGAGRPVVAAAVFTTNKAAAAPVALSRTHIANGYAEAVVINSGNANAATGAQGERDAGRMATATAGALECAVTDVLVCSTGPIGVPLPIDALEEGINALAPELGDTSSHGKAAAEAIMTTDTFPKTSVFEGAEWTVGGIAKGAAMVRPDMATMLAVVTTDVVIGIEQARVALRTAVDKSFNLLNIDGCTSTNDTVVLLASGESGVQADLDEFTEALTSVCASLARQIVRDGEETTKVVDLVVEGAPSDAAARAVGLEISDSDLVRSSFHGGDPNWGRILQAIGQSTINVDPSSLRVSYDGTLVAEHGVAVSHDREDLLGRLTGDFTVVVGVGDGPGSARILTTDLTPGYVTFNAEPS